MRRSCFGLGLLLVASGCGDEGTSSSTGAATGGTTAVPAACPIGQAPCPGACVYLLSDPNHCGQCGLACTADQVCSAGVCVPTTTGTGGTSSGGSGAGESGGTPPTTGGSPPTTGGSGGTPPTTGGSGGAVPTGGTGGDPLPTGGSGGASTGGSGGISTGGSGGTVSATCMGLPRLEPEGTPFDCGTSGEVLLNVGAPENRVNYVLTGDGYTQALLDTLLIEHVENMLYHEQGMLSAYGEPYLTYRNFINICVVKVASNDACVDDLDTGLSCDTAFDGSGDDASRLGTVDRSLVLAALGERLPATVDVDWVGVTINAGPTNWWNSGGSVMVFNGSFTPQSRAASVALHEGGHTFHHLADEYTGTSTNCSSAPEVNVATDNSGSKWAEWLGFDHNPGTGVHGSYEGGRYCTSGIWRPTDNSEMNMLPDYFNMPSMQKMIHDFYAIVRPIDAHTDNSSTLVDPVAIQVRVVDPEILKVEWSVDGAVVTSDGGECFDPTSVGAGTHTVTARAYDETPWVRDDRSDLEETVTWTISQQ